MSAIPVSSFPKQAVVVIHGMGEQKPMDTIRGFVRAVWETDSSVTRVDIPDPEAVWSKPDSRTGSLELRRITTRESKASATYPDGVRTDFYEFYWADLSGGSTWGQVKDWIWMLLFRNPFATVPADVFLAWLFLWLAALLVAVLAVATVLPADAMVFGRALWSFPPLLWFAGVQSWLLAVMTASFAFVTNSFVVPYFGRVVRYTRAKPENIQARKDIRERGLTLLNELHGREYGRIIIVAHSLGTIVANDLITYFWAARLDARTIGEREEGFDLLRKLQAAAMVLNDASQEEIASKRQAYLDAQRNFCRMLRQRGRKGQEEKRWLITDLVTVGSPLTHAEFLLARNKADFDARKEEREVPASPPVLEALDAGAYDAAKGAGLPFDPKKPELLCFPLGDDRWQLHHAAPYAAVRWTNIHDPAVLVGFGDLISGPVAPLFGPGVIDVDLRERRGQSFRFTHSRYWALSDKDLATPRAHLVELRKALDLAGDRSLP